MTKPLVLCGLVGILRCTPPPFVGFADISPAGGITQNDIFFKLSVLSVVLNAVKDPDPRQGSEIMPKAPLTQGRHEILRVAQNDIGFRFSLDFLLQQHDAEGSSQLFTDLLQFADFFEAAFFVESKACGVFCGDLGDEVYDAHFLTLFY